MIICRCSVLLLGLLDFGLDSGGFASAGALPIPCTVRPLISDKNLDKPLYPFASLTALFLPHRSPLREQALDSQPARQKSVATFVTTSQKHTSDKPR